jgi:hypothetical protein
MSKQIEANKSYRRTDDNHLPDVSAQDIEHARNVLGLNNQGGRLVASKHVVSPRPRKDKAEVQQRRKSFARKLAASAFRTARWGRP